MHPALSPPSMNERPRLLIVDDERGVRESLRAILQGDCEVFAASTGDEALAIVGREAVDVVTLDLKMPGLGGIGVLQRIASAPSTTSRSRSTATTFASSCRPHSPGAPRRSA
ncbi:MAG: response regulator [Deltaproteobacteria bacterium]|nr:MAG: response regulator [Deltaproteobacteria bacterium]